MTLIASWMNVEALKASEVMARRGIEVEIIDARCISSVDMRTISRSIRKTGRCIIADYDWVHCGFSAELAAQIYHKCISSLTERVVRMGFIHTPCPTARHLENEFYPSAINIIKEIEDLFDLEEINLDGEEFYSYEKKFKGPF